jgi:phosphoglycolate phosphatase-like HAD superfamily hydrolase
MEKPILATNIDGFLINHEAFIEPHRIWFDRAILLTKDNSFKKWKGNPEYFKGVNQAMEKILPEASKEQRTQKAREWYQEDVAHYISIHPEVVNKKLEEILKKLKQRFTLALITTNTEEYINKILENAGLKGIYDIIHASKTKEEPSKEKTFKEFKEKYGEPKYYIASRSKEAFEQCKSLGTVCIYLAPDEINPEIKNVANKTITEYSELEESLVA